MSEPQTHPTHLDPSDLGTKEYWDTYYQNDLDLDPEDDAIDPAELESWFDDVNAPTKVLEHLTSSTFPLSPSNPDRAVQTPTVLDLGTGNGSMLFRLRMEGGYDGPMMGVDYSQQSVDLARRLGKVYLADGSENDASDSASVVKAPIQFEVVDLIRDTPQSEVWWPQRGYDLVLDKGTFDAISLSDEVVQVDGESRRICEVYPRKVVGMVAVGGFLVITSCNWTEEEVLRWFLRGEGVEGQLEVFDKIDYPVFEFGGKKGSGVVTLCFKRVDKRRDAVR